MTGLATSTEVSSRLAFRFRLSRALNGVIVGLLINRRDRLPGINAFCLLMSGRAHPRCSGRLKTARNSLIPLFRAWSETQVGRCHQLSPELSGQSFLWVLEFGLKDLLQYKVRLTNSSPLQFMSIKTDWRPLRSARTRGCFRQPSPNCVKVLVPMRSRNIPKPMPTLLLFRDLTNT